MRLRTTTAIILAAELSIAATAGARATQAPATTGQVLYTANWKTGLAGWQAGGARWRVAGGTLSNTIADPSSILAPYKLSRPNYAVQATIRLEAWKHSGSSEDNVFGILFRGAAQGGSNPATGLVGGVARGFLGCDGIFSWAGIATADTDSEVLKETSKFRPDHGWHSYRLEVRGDQMRLLVDGTVRNAVTSKRLAGQRSVGLYALAASIQVRDFRVFGL